jgi:hypothetical protein
MSESNNVIEMYKNENIEIKIDQERKMLYINVINGNYIKNNFMEAVENYKNFYFYIFIFIHFYYIITF